MFADDGRVKCLVVSGFRDNEQRVSGSGSDSEVESTDLVVREHDEGLLELAALGLDGSSETRAR